MTLKENICRILEECGFQLKSVAGYSIQIYVKDNVIINIEEKEKKKNAE